MRKHSNGLSLPSRPRRQTHPNARQSATASACSNRAVMAVNPAHGLPRQFAQRLDGILVLLHAGSLDVFPVCQRLADFIAQGIASVIAPFLAIRINQGEPLLLLGDQFFPWSSTSTFSLLTFVGQAMQWGAAHSGGYVRRLGCRFVADAFQQQVNALRAGKTVAMAVWSRMLLRFHLSFHYLGYYGAATKRGISIPSQTQASPAATSRTSFHHVWGSRDFQPVIIPDVAMREAVLPETIGPRSKTWYTNRRLLRISRYAFHLQTVHVPLGVKLAGQLVINRVERRFRINPTGQDDIRQDVQQVLSPRLSPNSITRQPPRRW